MYRRLTSRGALAATSGLVAAGVALVFVLPTFSPEDAGTGRPLGLGPVASEELDLLQSPQEVARSSEGLGAGNQAFASNESLAADSEAPVPEVFVDEAGPTVTMGDGPPAPFVSGAKPAPAQLRATLGLTPSEAPAGGLAAKRLASMPPRADTMVFPPADTEAFPDADENDLRQVSQSPVSTFSVDVDTASYAIVRNSLMSGTLPPPGAVRAEEMINYFPYAYPGPEGDAPFATQVTVTPTPWNADTRLIHIGLQGQMPATEDRPPLNLVFLIDSSGSMQAQNKLPLLKQSLRMMLPQLTAQDEVAIVTYAGNAGQVLAPTPAPDTAAIYAALDQIQAGGSTAGQAGLQQAYSLAQSMAAEGEISRVILATDGDFNVGLSDPSALKDFIAGKRKSGTYLSVLGFGRGNLDDATMQALAQNGNGQAAYIDTLNEARKVLVDQLTGALFPIANDVKVQVEFNPATVAEYRLIGYETRALRRQDFNNDRVDAGEIGAGHRVTALYEVTPVGSPAVSVDPLRYGSGDAARPAGGSLDELGFLRLRYKAPGAEASQLIETPISTELGTGTSETRFATAIAGFAQLLKGNQALQDWTYADAIALASDARGEDRFGYRAEAIQLMRLADTLSRQ